MIKSTIEKALHLNLRPEVYGTFSEIGAGQDVANHFFKAGAAGGTVAKSLSAYDMTISNSYYGKTKRFVSKQRLEDMLQTEYDQLLNQLSIKAFDKSFFAFSSTVETLNYHKTNQGQGWIGVKYQTAPNKPPDEFIIHVLLHGEDALEQQELLGTLGVNILYELYQPHGSLEPLMKNLLQNLKSEKIEINTLTTNGPRFQKEDPRLVTLKLVKHKLTKMTMIGSKNTILQPLNSFYKRDILLQRESLISFPDKHKDMLKSAQRYTTSSTNNSYNKSLLVAELSTYQMVLKGDNIDENEYLRRTEELVAAGYNIIISNFNEPEELSTYLSDFVNYTSLGLVINQQDFESLCNSYSTGEKNILSSFSSLCNAKNSLFIFPKPNAQKNNEIHILDSSTSRFDRSLINALIVDQKLILLNQDTDRDHEAPEKHKLTIVKPTRGNSSIAPPSKIIDAIINYSRRISTNNSSSCQSF